MELKLKDRLKQLLKSPSTTPYRKHCLHSAKSQSLIDSLFFFVFDVVTLCKHSRYDLIIMEFSF